MDKPEKNNEKSSDNRTLADEHRDIEFGNNYRLEYIKHLISISTGVIIFSVTFMKDIITIQSVQKVDKYVLAVGWFMLLISVFAGILHMRYWAWYYISWGTNWEKPSAKLWRRKINIRRKIAEKLQVGGFIIGLTLLTIFTLLLIFK
ncbi:MAG: hypothetical protein M0D53_08790 [Flavobacterium sp. JAD_PAG50586_2]|nr:MAG: hypothetical protein M0D53_08790 [Flavobacterium sp. JAD_PAG50586_2]